MVGVATAKKANLCGRVRRSPARSPDVGRVAESIRVLPAPWTHTLRDRADQWRTCFCAGLQPSKESEGMGLEPPTFVPVLALCTIHLQQCGGDYRRVIANIC